jgi:hypothetical protein
MIEYITLFSSPAENIIFLSTVLFYILFIAYVVLSRVTSQPNYYALFIKRHYQFGFLYLAFTSVYIAYKFGFSIEISIRILIGLFLFFLYQYGFIFLLVNAMKKSVSLNLLASLHKGGGRLSLALLGETHADGKGLKFVTEDRIDQLIATQCLAYKNDKYSITPKGKFILKLSNLLLRIFCLKRFL